MHRSKWILSLFAVLLMPLVARAQTAEDTIAYIVLGAEDGAAFASGNPGRWRQSGNGVFVGEAAGEIGTTGASSGTLTVAQTEKCVFKIEVIAGKKVELASTVDLRNAKVALDKFEGWPIAAIGENVECREGMGCKPFWLLNKVTDRHPKAIKHLATMCGKPPSAF